MGYEESVMHMRATFKIRNIRKGAAPLAPAYQITLFKGEIAICPFCCTILEGRKDCLKCGQRIKWAIKEDR